ncbi:hypothetical protein [Niallia sp. 03190]|uniref:hypothetical protein n=1 Tax=Niallia sp. 03190 TaxID=3458061 RepID=UPI00404431BB
MGRLYSNKDILAGRLIDDTTSLRCYNGQILQKVQALYAKRKINHYEYSHFVNVITCMDLKLDDVKNKLNSLIDNQIMNNNSFDFKI